MAFLDLREWIRDLQEQGDLLTVHQTVAAREELGSVCRLLLDRGPNHAILFESVDDSPIPVFANGFSTRERVNRALGVSDHNRMQFLLERWERGIPPVEVLSREAPVKETVKTGDEASFHDFPIPWHNWEDGGPYISFGVLISQDPESGRHNLSYQRMQIVGPRRALINVEPNKHARRILDHLRERGQSMPVAVAVGLDPAINLAAAASPGSDVSEYDLAGSFRDQPVPCVRAEGGNLLVPAYAEVVFEGRILPQEFGQEGPFAEFTGHYGLVGPNPVFELDAVTTRLHPIYQTLYTGMPVCDNHVMQEFLRSGKVWQRLRETLPNITEVYCPPQGGNGFTVYIAMHKHHDGEPKLAMMAAWTTFHYVKHVVVVDADVNIYEAVQREWAVATRVQADRDVLIVPGMMGHILDPSAQGRVGEPVRLGISEVARGTRAVMGIDATRPLGVDFPKVVQVDRTMLKKAATIVDAALRSTNAKE